jgi:acyl carrier protein
MADTMDRVKKVVVELLKIDTAMIQASSRFVEDLGADSMQSIELVAAFEEEFDIEMDEDAALAVKNVADAVKFIDEVIAQQH